MKILDKLKEQFIYDFKHNKPILFLEFAGTVASIIASLSLAILGSSANLYYIFVFYMLGSVLWCVASKARNNMFMLILSLFYTIINIIGIAKLFFF